MGPLLRQRIRRVFRGAPKGLKVEATRSVVTAGVSAIADYGTLIPLVELLSLSPVVASAVGVVAGQLTSYALHSLWIFPSRQHGYHKSQLLLFLAIGALTLLIHTVSMVVLIRHTAFYYLVAKLISILLMFSLGFLLRRVSHRLLRGDFRST
ncbi:MAG: GtrA family protein [Alkalispirochaetaceae bacterium]